MESSGLKTNLEYILVTNCIPHMIRFIRVGYEGYTQRPGAVIFAAPEKMLTGLICGAGDVFSFGMIACFLTSKDASLLLDAQEIYKVS